MIRKRLVPRGQSTEGGEGTTEGNINTENIPRGEGEEQVTKHESGMENLNINTVENQSQGQSHGHESSNIQSSQGEFHGEKSAEQKKKIRCKKWPQCKNENCEFGHPKETVTIIIN